MPPKVEDTPQSRAIAAELAALALTVPIAQLEWDYELEMTSFVLKTKVSGPVDIDNFELVTEEVPELLPGSILTVAEWISVDPYVREINMLDMQPGDPIPGTQIARVIKSECEEFPIETRVIGYFGWRNLTVYTPIPKGKRSYMTICKLPDLKGLPQSYALGCLGLPGNVAYWTIVDVLKPKAGENIVVTSAGGAVGSIAAQIGRIKGCRVTAFAGSEDKLKWMQKYLRIHQISNYKTMEEYEISFRENIFPKGIDCLFDTVGGDFLCQAMKYMNLKGRIAQVGSLSNLNRIEMRGQIPIEPFDYTSLRGRQLTIEGVNPKKYLSKGYEGIYKIRNWILEGRINVRETVSVGFESCADAFIDMLNGENVGKQLIRVIPFNPNDYRSTFPKPEEPPKERFQKYTRAGREVEGVVHIHQKKHSSDDHKGKFSSQVKITRPGVLSPIGRPFKSEQNMASQKILNEKINIGSKGDKKK